MRVHDNLTPSQAIKSPSSYLSFSYSPGFLANQSQELEGYEEGYRGTWHTPPQPRLWFAKSSGGVRAF